MSPQIARMQLRQRGEDHGDTVDVETDPDMLALTAEIDEKVKASEEQGEQGNVDESMALLEQAERACCVAAAQTACHCAPRPPQSCGRRRR